ncbi:hypothetical protein A2U01_0091565, partial [Trifolium medium]|nr:hypothetical protein [Trifolium medium]
MSALPVDRNGLPRSRGSTSLSSYMSSITKSAGNTKH